MIVMRNMFFLKLLLWKMKKAMFSVIIATAAKGKMFNQKYEFYGVD